MKKKPKKIEKEQNKFNKLLSQKDREIIEKAVHKVAQEYGETLKLLGKT
ncbi:MAG: hypothetical protein ISS88_02345 [Candidatus Portnoybacteria bacterium]|nr:hypothetical protein [Candidatus Portnoybacteria bacterium]